MSDKTVIIVDDQAEKSRLRTALHGVADLSICTEPPPCTHPDGILMVTRRHGAIAALAAAALRREYQGVPIGIVTDCTELSNGLLRSDGLVLDIRDAPVTWVDAIRAMRDPLIHERRVLAQRARDAGHLSEWVRHAIIRMAVTTPPFRTVGALARSLACSESTLRRHFAVCNTQWRLEDFVGWFVLCYYESDNRHACINGRPDHRTLKALRRRLAVAADSPASPPPVAGWDGLQTLLEPPV